eukprot:scaffold195147_cov15-Tisochrysis_lutea.AAC.1
MYCSLHAHAAIASGAWRTQIVQHKRRSNCCLECLTKCFKCAASCKLEQQAFCRNTANVSL